MRHRTRTVWSPSRRRAERRARGDRGLAIVEFAVVAPLLALLVAGIIEFGTGWRDSLTVTNATRAAARVVSNLGDDRQADREALESLRAALAGMTDVTVDGVMIFEANALDGAPDPLCFDVGGNPIGSDPGNCNYYTYAQIQTLGPGDFTAGSCSGEPDENFCPLTDRSVDQSLGLTPVGVWVRVNRGWYTDVFPGSGYTITDLTVMNAEPRS